MRNAAITRKTAETEVEIYLCLDGRGQASADSGIGFLDHMLTLLAKHGLLDIHLSCRGDLEVDGHHTVEDIGIVLGQAVSRALGDMKGIDRYATAFTPMDEALTMVSMDISGRGYLFMDLPLDREYVGGFETELLEEFLRAFACNAGITLHVKLVHGRNCHHIIESVFKGLGRTLDTACAVSGRREGVPSTKGPVIC